MPTNAEKRRQQKRKAREKRIRHYANVRRNNIGKPKYRLDVFLEGSWRMGVMTFKTAEQVRWHREDTKKRRERGEEIVAGRIVLLETGKVIESIEASPAKEMKVTLPDKALKGESEKSELLTKETEKGELLAKEPEKKGLFGFFKKS